MEDNQATGGWQPADLALPGHRIEVPDQGQTGIIKSAFIPVARGYPPAAN